jgi:hypothetical protein
LVAAALGLVAIGAATLAVYVTVRHKPVPRVETTPAKAVEGGAAPAHAISPRTRAILDILEEPIEMGFPDETPLDAIILYIKYATFKGKPTDPGLPIYVDPVGLKEAGRTATSAVRINAPGSPLRLTLSLCLDQLGLAYIVKDDVLFISSPEGIDRERSEPASPPADGSPGTKRVLAKLEEPIPMSFADPTPLDAMLNYIRYATTTSRGDDGIPIVSDPRGLQEAGCSLTSTVSIDLDGVPLKSTLKLMLKQLGLAYAVNDGTVIISSAQGIRTRWTSPAGRLPR